MSKEIIIEGGDSNIFRELKLTDAALKHAKGTLAALLVKHAGERADNIDWWRRQPIKELIRELELYGTVELEVKFKPK